MNRITQEDIAEIKELASTLPPFTITITDPTDGTKLVSAFLYAHGGGQEGGELMAATLGMSCKALGHDKGVDVWFDTVNNLCKDGRPKLPTFLKGVIKHYFNHIEQEFHKK